MFWKNILDRHPQINLTIVDPFEIDSLEDYSHKRIKGLWQEVLPGIPEASFDLVTAIDLVEHLPKHEGLQLFYQLERISKNTAVVYTPNGFLWQPPSSNNIFNAHITGWHVTELKRFGFNYIRGHVGLRALFGPYAERKENMFTFPLSVPMMTISFFMATLFPRSAYALSAWLDCNQPRNVVDQAR